MKLNQAINNGLHAIADEMKNNREYNRESKDRDELYGCLTDEEKVRMLKYDLYRATRSRADSDYQFQIRCSIETLSKEIDKKYKRQNSLLNQICEITKLCVGLLALATVGSYTVQASGACQHNNSRFCNDSRKIPYAIERYFADQPVLKPENNVIDQQSFNPPKDSPRPKCKEYRSCGSSGTRLV